MPKKKKPPQVDAAAGITHESQPTSQISTAPAATKYVGAATHRMALASLKPAPWNPRSITPQALAGLGESITRFGLVQPIIWNRRSGQVVGGHQRVKALESKGATETDVVVVDLSEAEERALNLALNSQAISGEWTVDALALLKQVHLELPDLSSALRLPDLTGLLENQFHVRPEVIEDEAPAPAIASPITKPGDLYVLGAHRLMCGDSSLPRDVARLCDGSAPSMVFTSPPYNVSIAYETWDDEVPKREYLARIEAVVRAWADVLALGGFVAWNVGVSPRTYHFDHARILEEAGLTFFRQIVWRKQGISYPIWQFTRDAARARKYTPNYQHELVMLFTKGPAVEGGGVQVDESFSSDVWDVHQSSATAAIPGQTAGKDTKNEKHGSHKLAAHPAPFPVRLAAGGIGHLSAPGEIVADPYSGSGTTIIACEQLGRRCFAMEIDPVYVDVTVSRWESFTGRKAERVSSGGKGG